MTHPIELGLDTFGDVTEQAGAEPTTGRTVSQAQVVRDMVDQAVLADQVGLDFIGLGEHHREDFVVSAPEVILAAMAARTSRIHLGTAVTVLSSDDPIRVYQRFATIDAVSGGRAEVVLGRGAFTESFPLFGYDLGDYELLFEEKMSLFAELLKDSPVNWQGRIRPPLKDQWIYPRPESGTIKTWMGVGGSVESVARTAGYGLPMFLALTRGSPASFVKHAELHRRCLAQYGHAPQPIAIHSPGFVAETDELAKEIIYPYHFRQQNEMALERGWPPYTRAQFEQQVSENGSFYVGSPETVATKIVAALATLGASRFDMRYSIGRLPHTMMLRSIELYGSKVAPLVRERLGYPG